MSDLTIVANRLNVVKELHVDLVSQILGLAHKLLEVLASSVLGSSHIAALVVVLLCRYSKEVGAKMKADQYLLSLYKMGITAIRREGALTKDNDGVGVVTATTGLVSMAIRFLIRVGTSSYLLQEVDDLVCLFGTLGLDAVRWQPTFAHERG